MPANDSWMFQGRQQHGWFGDGTSPEHANDDAAGNPRLFLPENASNRVVYIVSDIIGHAPRAQRGRWSTANHAADDDLKTAIAAWCASPHLSRDVFRDRFLERSTPDQTVDDLRAAARGAVEGRSYDDLARAGNHLAAAALSLGPDRWPRFVGGPARSALAAVDARSVPGVIKAGAADTEGGLTWLGIIAVLGGLAYLSSRKPSAQPAPPPALPSILEVRPPQDAKDPNGAKAPGKPGEAEEFEDP